MERSDVDIARFARCIIVYAEANRDDGWRILCILGSAVNHAAANEDDLSLLEGDADILPDRIASFPALDEYDMKIPVVPVAELPVRRYDHTIAGVYLQMTAPGNPLQHIF